MRVLLISPLDPPDPHNLRLLMGGENTYSRLLLRYPPPGIQFIHIEEALKNGAVSYHWSHNLFLWLQKFRILPLGPRTQVLILKTKFDLAYAHGHPVKLIGSSVPLVLSLSSLNATTLLHYFKYSMWWVRLGNWIKKNIFTICGIADIEVTSDYADRCFVFSKWAEKNMQVDVIYPGLPIPQKKEKEKKRKKGIKLLFIGIWFERKGGSVLLKVFRRLTKLFPYIHLTMIGPLPDGITIHPDEPISHLDFLPNSEILKLYETHDILVHIPPKIEGYGMVVVEAMSYGVIPVVSAVCALSEIVEHGKSGLVIKAGSALALERALRSLLKDRSYNYESLSCGARDRFKKLFSLRVFHRQLSIEFRAAIDSHRLSQGS